MRVNDRYTSFYYATDDDWGTVEIDRTKTALLIIDMQNYFVRRPIYTDPTPRDLVEKERWAPFYDMIEAETIPNNVKILHLFRELGMDVAFARITCQREDGRDRSLDHKATGFNELRLPLGDPAGCGPAAGAFKVCPQLAEQLPPTAEVVAEKLVPAKDG